MNDYAVTIFPSSKETIPCAEHTRLSWPELCNVYAGEIFVTDNKTRVPYAVPCPLQDAPYVGKTAARMVKRGLRTGRQRSAGHMTVARVLVSEFDGLPRAHLHKVIANLRQLECLCLVYSSYSHGNPDKSGARFRVLIALDRNVTSTEYTTLWQAINAQVFGGLADSSSRHMYQQQGVWASHPDWSNKAFKVVGQGEPLDCDRWMPSQTMTVINPEQVSSVATPEQVRRVRQALRWLDLSEHEQWITAGAALKVLDADAFEQDWIAFSEPSDDPRYNPESVWSSLKPNMPAEAAYRTILARARDGATEAVEKCRGLKQFTPDGEAAAMYLQQNHKRHWRELNGGQ